MGQYRINDVSDIAPGEMRRFDVEGIPVCVVHAQGGSYFAMRDVCSHEEFPLSDGWTYDNEIECGRHNSVFNLVTGEALSLPATDPIDIFPVSIDGSGLLVTIERGTP
jgi:3-phenylpropionate/trans-cinnamate dioxygenase ferredoxin component